MPTRNHLYKKVLDTAPFGTVFFAYGVCIDANDQALCILDCQRSHLIGAAIAEEQDHRTSTVQQLPQVVRKLQADELEGILWRSDDILGQDEVVVSMGDVKDDEGMLSLMLYLLPSLARMVVQEFSTSGLKMLDTSLNDRFENSAEQKRAEQLSPQEIHGTHFDSEEQISPDMLKMESKLAESIKSDQYETLSGLPVSPRLIDSISKYLESSHEDSPCGTLLLIDFDNFNSINESLGKHIGNQILERADETIRGMCTELMEVDQVAGDSFLLFARDIADSAQQARDFSLQLANEIRYVINRPFFTENGEVSVTASVGISVLYSGVYYPSEDSLSNAEEAVQQAESAMFEAKRRGRDTVVLFDSQITRQARQRINMESSLRKAVANQEFDLYVQPQVSTQNSEVVGGEVLMR